MTNPSELANGVVSSRDHGRPFTLTRQGDGCLVSFQAEGGQYVVERVEADSLEEFGKVLRAHGLDVPS